MNKSVEFEVGVKFLKPFELHKLLKCIGLDWKYNPGHVKAFYYYLKITSDGIEWFFHDQVIKFMVNDFKHHFGLESKGSKVCISNLFCIVRGDFAKSISNIF